MIKNLESLFRTNRVFVFLIIYRWASLVPVFFVLTAGNAPLISPLWALFIALATNVFISIYNHRLNTFVLDYPILLGVDILFSAALLSISGGTNSPYYLFALSPLLAGAFFFQVRGALLASLLFTPLYILPGLFNLHIQLDTNTLATHLVGIWLLPLLFAYPSTLLKSVNRATAELSAAHRQLEIIHDLTVLLQAAPDLISVQERVLGAVTTELGFSKAVVALVDPAREELGGWMVYPPQDDFPQVHPLSLKSENGEAVKALLTRGNYVSNGQALIKDAHLSKWLNQNKWFVTPLYLREHPVGILLVEESGLTKERESTLMTVANQAALALGTTILCIDRARRLAVETERNRIARDIHDTVAQSLFGITYSLEACINMLPQQAEDVKKELIELQALAGIANDEVRHSVFDLWPSALTIELFMADLTNYINNCCRPRSFSIIFNHHGDFNSLPPGLRRAIYRMAQEALANSARHSGAQSARLCMTVAQQEVFLDISDQGQGFDPSVALSRSQNREHFGLHGIQERASALGGGCEIISRPDAGSRVMIQLPITGIPHA
ncbi:MAG: sensor histidine kinase [Anaerolineales bacterium]|jgi:signal transduction histidine kinase|nr:sensor histidine kinase [Anaerolineales bacterium]